MEKTLDEYLTAERMALFLTNFRAYYVGRSQEKLGQTTNKEWFEAFADYLGYVLSFNSKKSV